LARECLALRLRLLLGRGCATACLELGVALLSGLLLFDLLLAGVGSGFGGKLMAFGFNLLLAFDDFGLALFVLGCGLELGRLGSCFSLVPMQLALALEIFVTDQRAGYLLGGALDAIGEASGHSGVAHESSFANLGLGTG
jgi:hypothetical protein